ncbi:MAG: hypothetical protein CMI18_07915 [Opitutaceae bacterium]|nr:hypothetical protein [Opitutaceae bacterium]|tara:strand:+ start:130 stop:1704 length:1575 start_codon:yes stop_codon:yes gene_type:complete
MLKNSPSILCTLLFSTICLKAGNWPQAGGPNGNFTIENATVPKKWSAVLEQNIAWKKQLPELGQSSVTIWEDKLFFAINQPVLKDTVLGKDIIAYCISVEDGSTLWKREIIGTHPLKIGSTFGDSSGLPAVTNGNIVVFFNASGAIEGFDLFGNRLWRREALSSYRGSPFLVGNKLIYVQMNWPPDEKGGYPHPKEELHVSEWTQMQAIDIKSGKPLWSTLCGANIGSQPLPLKLDDGRVALVVGRGGGHTPPEKPLGISLVDASDGTEIWKLTIDNWECRQTISVYKGMIPIINDEEQWWIDIQNGKIVRKVSIIKDVPVCLNKGAKWKTKTMTLKTSERSYEVIGQSNLLIGQYHYYRSYQHNYLGRVNMDTGKVEYLQLPTSMLKQPGKPDQLVWDISDLASKPEKTFYVPTETSYWNLKTNSVKNSRGFKLLGDIRAQGNGWGHVSSPIPTAFGDTLFLPIMNGMVYVIDWDMELLNENAIIAINDLGPLGESFTRSNISYSNGKLFAQTIQELICIGGN